MTRLDPDMAASEWRRILDSRSGRNRRRTVGFVVVLSCLVCLIVIGYRERERASRWPVLTIHEIDLTGNRIVADSDVFDLLGVRAGDPWWRLSGSAVESRSSSQPWIQGLRLRYSWFHRLRVEVVERQPSMAVLAPLEGDLTVDGWFVGNRPSALAEDLPIFRPAAGSIPAPGSRADQPAADVARLMGDLRRTSPNLWKQISEVEMREDCACAYLRSGNAVILFLPGVHEDFWSKVPVVLDDLRRQGREDPVVDLRFRKGILIHLPEAILADTVASAPKGRA